MAAGVIYPIRDSEITDLPVCVTCLITWLIPAMVYVEKGQIV